MEDKPHTIKSNEIARLQNLESSNVIFNVKYAIEPIDSELK